MSLAICEGAFVRRYGADYLWPLSVAMYRNPMLCWVNDYEDLWRVGGKAFMEWILFSKNRKELEKNYALHGLALEKLQVKLDSLALSDFSDDELTGLWDSFLEAIVDFQADAMLVELANYGGEKILESQLKKELSNESNVKKAMQVLTAPEALSFYQQKQHL